MRKKFFIIEKFNIFGKITNTKVTTMKSFTRILLLTVILLTTVLGIQAQVSSYSFSSSSGTYNEISGGVVLHSSFADDALSTGSIGFAFKYNAIDYTSIKVNSNGWASFGTTTSNGTYTPLSSGASPWYGNHHPCLSPLGADLQGKTGGAVRIQTIGSAPNRVCIIQWKDTAAPKLSTFKSGFTKQQMLFSLYTARWLLLPPQHTIVE
jgi:hypothetical protein